MIQRVVLLVLLIWLLAGTAAAQRRVARGALLDRPRVGPHLGYNFDADALTLGVQATLPVTARIELYPSFDYYSISPGTLWGINVDMKFRPPTRLGALYVGGGFDYLHSNAGGGTGDVQLDFLGGWEWRRLPLVPYAEGRLILGSGSTFQIVGGINFRLQ